MSLDLTADITSLIHANAISLDKLELVEIGKLPNQRTLIIPDPGYTIVDMDLDRADAQFVAWEANDDTLKAILKAGADLHLENAKAIWGDHITKKSPERQLAKRFCHAVNYGAYPKKLAKALGISVKLAEWIYARWFQIHPGIRDWHKRVKADLFSKRLVTNPFGYERYYFDRPEKCINEALAWCPQSSVGIIINTAWDNIDTNLPEVEVLMQVHDSLTMQVKTDRVLALLPEIQQQSLIPVPYADPLIIPVGFKISDVSWGAANDPCEYIDDKDPSKGRHNPELYLQLKQGLDNAKSKAAA
jgi:hypothetical protein